MIGKSRQYDWVFSAEIAKRALVETKEIVSKICKSIPPVKIYRPGKVKTTEPKIRTKQKTTSDW
jgi:hypothetical protein